ERFVARLTRHDDERHVLEIRVLLELVADRKAVHPRQLDGKENQVGSVRRRLLEPCTAIVDDGGGAPQLAELASQLTGERGVALEHEDFGGHARGLRTPEDRSVLCARNRRNLPQIKAYAPARNSVNACAVWTLFPGDRWYPACVRA